MNETFTVAAINRKTEKQFPPRYDLKPMNHAAACNFMDACRNEYTDYVIIPWPGPHEEILTAEGYRSDKNK